MNIRPLVALGLIAITLCVGMRFAWPQATSYWTQDGKWSSPRFAAVSSSIGGALLLLGACQSTDVTINGVTTAMTAVVSPQTDPGNAVQWQAFIKSANTVTVRICALASVTPASTVYNIKVLQ